MKSRIMAASFSGAVALSAFLVGCSFSPNDPAVQTEFYDSMEYLNRPADKTDPSSRFVMAKEIFNRVDVGSVKDSSQLVKLIGKPTKTSGTEASQVWEYDFIPSPYAKEVYEIKATFRIEGSKVVSAKINNPN